MSIICRWTNPKRVRGVLVSAFVVLLLCATRAEATEPVLFIKHTHDPYTGYTVDARIWRTDLSGTFEYPLPLAYAGCMSWDTEHDCTLTAESLAVSPDGRKVAFIHSGELLVAAVDGSSTQHVLRSRIGSNPLQTNCEGPCDLYHLDGWSDPAWSPDGQRLAVTWDDWTTPGGEGDLEIVNVDGSGRHKVGSWAGAQSKPRFSPDGTRIGFLSYSGPNGPSQGSATIWTVRPDGSDPTPVFSGTLGNGSGAWGLAWSPSGTEIATSDESNVWIVSADGNNQSRQVTFLPRAGDIDDLSWSVDGETILFTKIRPLLVEVDGTGLRDLIPAASLDTSERYYAMFRSVTGPQQAPFVPSDAEVLHRYTPALRFDSLEAYRADSPAALTESYVPGRGGHSNLLNRASGTILAQSDPALKGDTLNLGYLRPIYPSSKPTSAVGSDAVDAANPFAYTYLEDATRMHELAGYGDRVVGRVVTHAGGERTAQYWLFYYDNPKTYGGIGAHEGDWEMVQVRLNAFGDPTSAAYAQHTSGEVCDWGYVEKTATGQPVVYVAEGSHASYFTAGFHSGAVDSADGAYKVDDLTMLPVSTGIGGWIDWPGHWGGSGDSPLGPRYQGLKWDAPDRWHFEGREPCTVEEPASAARLGKRKAHPRGIRRTPPPELAVPPALSVDRVGRFLRVHYDFAESRDAGAGLPRRIIVSAARSDRSVIPATLRQSVPPSGRGTVRLPWSSPGPVVVRAAGESREGERGVKGRIVVG